MSGQSLLPSRSVDGFLDAFWYRHRGKAQVRIGHRQVLELAPVVLEDLLRAEELADVAWALDLPNTAGIGGTGDG